MSDSGNPASLRRVDMSVRELLTEMKDSSEVIVDLAYAALMYNSQSIAEKVRELEDDIDDLKFEIRYKVLLSARTREDARQLSGILEVASAADLISDAASEIVGLLKLPAEKRPYISEMLSEADEKIRMIRISPPSDMAGNTIGKLQVEANTGCKIIAVKNRHGWTYDPEDSMKLRTNDDIIVRGTDDGADLLTRLASGSEGWEFPEKVTEDEGQAEAEEDAVEEDALSEELRGEGEEE